MWLKAKNKVNTMDKYLSIITNFGCHFKCPYCITKENELHIPRTTLDGLERLESAIRENDCNIISISGGGDPLYNYEDNVVWYYRLAGILEKCLVGKEQKPIPIEMHTSYMTDETTFPFEVCARAVYHANTIEQLDHIHRKGNEIVRVVFVVTDDFTIEKIEDICRYVKYSDEIDELSFRQFVDNNYEVHHHLEEYLKLYHKKRWYYIEQNDYNLYYAENVCFHRFKDLKFAALWSKPLIYVSNKDQTYAVLEDDESGYDFVAEYIKRYWDHNCIDSVVVRIGISYDGISYEYKNEVANATWDNDIEFDYDWWEGEKFIRILGIKSIEKLEISGGIYQD